MLACMFPCYLHAACEELFIKKVRFNLGIKYEINSSSEFISCKVMPGDSRKTIVAIAKRQVGTEINDSDTMGDYNLNLAIVDSKTRRVMIQRIYNKRFMSNGYRFDGIEVDSASYVVARKINVFGIKANSHMDFTSSESLNLFVVRNNKIDEILSDADMHIWFDVRHPGCESDSRESIRIAANGMGKTKGFYDLVVTEKLVDTKGEFDNPKCKPQQKIKIKKYILRFNGTRYVIPNEMKEFDCRVC